MSGASVNCPVRKCWTGYYQGEVCGLRREDRDEREGGRGKRRGEEEIGKGRGLIKREMKSRETCRHGFR